MINKILSFFYIPLGLVFLIGGLGIEGLWIPWGGLAVFSFLLVLITSKSSKIRFPKGFFLFLVIFALLVLNLFTTHDLEATMRYFLLYLSGGVLWLLSFNIFKGPREEKILISLIIFLGLFFGQYVMYEHIVGINTIKSFAITGYSGVDHNHNHIGDYFSIIAIISVYNLLKNKKNSLFWLFFSFISFTFIFISQSRSAIVSFGVPMLVFFLNDDRVKEFKKTGYFFAFLLTALALYFGRAKSLFLSREYFLQGIAGFWKHPIGVGMGNFQEISNDASNHLFGASSFSSMAHNLPLEFLTGIGYLGILFIAFYFYAFYMAIVNFRRSSMFALIFISLSVNFFFDFTYAIPTMLWIWFVALGVLTRSLSEEETYNR